MNNNNNNKNWFKVLPYVRTNDDEEFEFDDMYTDTEDYKTSNLNIQE
jgi:hypothetical protein